MKRFWLTPKYTRADLIAITVIATVITRIWEAL